MRIEKVVISNINSLAGRFMIDLTDPGYGEGLFAIVGPSGSGKTTVLDAICLALYGKTPRISMISDTQDEIMSRGRDECAAEAVFMSRGKRYKAVFAHQRTKRGAKPFRQAKREIWAEEPDGTWSIVAAMKREADIKIAEITGLSYEQFTRSIMLAQFQFAEFLKAGSNERADILEQITDMDIYRRISVAVYERKTSESKKYDDIRMRVDALRILEEDEKKALEQERQAFDKIIAEHNALKDAFYLCRDTIKKTAALQKEHEQYEKDKPEAEKKLAKAAALLEKAVHDEKREREAINGLQKTLKTVRELDSRITVKKEDMARIEKEIEDDRGRIRSFKNNILSVFKKYVPDAGSDRLKAMYDADDIADIIRTEAKSDADAAEREHKHIADEIKKTLGSRDAPYWQERIDLLEAVLPMAEAKRAVMQGQRVIKDLHAQQKTQIERDKALRIRLKEIADKFVYAKLEERFGQERASLTPGRPCPLCGATDHPYVQQTHDTRFLEEVGRQKDEAEKEQALLQKAMSDLNGRIAGITETIQQKTAVLSDGERALHEAGKTADDTGIDLSAEHAVEAVKQAVLEARGIVRSHTALLSKLNQASQQLNKANARLGEVDKDALAIQYNKQNIQEAQARQDKRLKALEQVQKDFGGLVSQRRSLFADKNPDDEEALAEKRMQKAQQDKEDCFAQKEKALRQAEQVGKDIVRTQQAIDAQNKKLAEAYADTFGTAADICAKQCKGDEGVTQAFDAFCSAAQRLDSGVVPELPVFDELIGRLSDLVSKETERKGAIGQRLETNAANIKEQKALKQDLQKAKKECDKWDRLNALIGSSDGVKFSRIAQGITFEVLLNFANSNLKKMTDRYILVRDDSNQSKPLELSVIDNYQAGDIRPVRNLSGGESFIVSMALALGLSEMSSGRTRIDSLFIDEGFASLDEDYLEAALQTLSSLGNREGKLVGVISHVDALKERIAAKIEVSKLSGGRSMLMGPGVKVLAEE